MQRQGRDTSAGSPSAAGWCCWGWGSLLAPPYPLPMHTNRTAMAKALPMPSAGSSEARSNEQVSQPGAGTEAVRFVQAPGRDFSWSKAQV